MLAINSEATKQVFMRLLLLDIMILEEGFRLQFFKFMSIILANLKIYIENVGKK